MGGKIQMRICFSLFNVQVQMMAFTAHSRLQLQHAYSSMVWEIQLKELLPSCTVML
jgi:hypothetical protein